MKFNYQSEKRKYINEWKRLEADYRTAGMSEYAIAAMKQFDWELFKKERVYCKHNQMLAARCYPDGNQAEDGGYDLPYADPKALSYEEQYFQKGRYDWIEDIENEAMVKRIRSLDRGRIELLTLYVFEEKTHQEIGEILGIERSLVTRRLKTIKKLLKN